ncbi:MAG: hypothetical protein JW791_01935 [Nanoarchaeota archaeon]|nr:hypothetical protein [Nanoarchaeota archaeon]
MFGALISLVLIISGLKLLFEVRKRYNIYFAVGFVLYGIQYLINDYIINDSVWAIIFNIPKVLGALCLMMSGIFFLKEGKE